MSCLPPLKCKKLCEIITTKKSTTEYTFKAASSKITKNIFIRSLHYTQSTTNSTKHTSHQPRECHK